jgi:hypothetical protein
LELTAEHVDSQRQSSCATLKARTPRRGKSTEIPVEKQIEKFGLFPEQHFRKDCLAVANTSEKLAPPAERRSATMVRGCRHRVRATQLAVIDLRCRASVARRERAERTSRTESVFEREGWEASLQASPPSQAAK